MTNVGDRPRHKVEAPSFCAIFRRPSHVLLIVRLSTSSTAHDTAAGLMGAMVGPATQYGAVLLTQNTSLQQAVIPILGGKSRNEVMVRVWGGRGDGTVGVVGV